MKISEVSKILNIPSSTIRYYEQRGIIISHRASNGYRDYNETSLELIKLLLYAKELGFSLSEIKVFAKAMQGSGFEKQKVNLAIEMKIDELNQKIKSFKKFQKNLKNVLKSKCQFEQIYKK
jgi:DNA-binding transcriptional MerR regulator